MEKEVNKESKKDNKKDNKKILEFKNKIEELTTKVSELDDKNKRISAELVNSLRRKDEETNRLLKYKNEDLILEILPIIDNFERAINMDDDNKNDEVSNFLKGMIMIYNNLKLVLEKYEVKEIDALDKEFDPSIHQAVLTEEKKDIKPNMVIEVMQKGYTYKDKVIRPAMVKVSK